MLYFNYRDELYHYGVKGMKWGEHIFGDDLTKLGDRIGAAADRIQEKSGTKLPSIKTYGQFKAGHGASMTKASSSGGSSSKKHVNMTQKIADDIARVLSAQGTAAKGKSGSGGKKGGSGKKSSGGNGKEKTESTTKATKITKEDIQKALGQVTESKVKSTSNMEKDQLKARIDGMSLTEVAKRAINGEFGEDYDLQELLGDRYSEFQKVLAQVISGKLTDDEEDENSSTTTKAVEKGKEYLKRMYANISLTKKSGSSK